MKKKNNERKAHQQLITRAKETPPCQLKYSEKLFTTFKRFRAIDSLRTVYCVYLRGTNWQNEVDKMKHFSSLTIYTSKYRCAHILSVPKTFRNMSIELKIIARFVFVLYNFARSIQFALCASFQICAFERTLIEISVFRHIFVFFFSFAIFIIFVLPGQERNPFDDFRLEMNVFR